LGIPATFGSQRPEISCLFDVTSWTFPELRRRGLGDNKRLT
jgi:hypothetical protein